MRAIAVTVLAVTLIAFGFLFLANLPSEPLDPNSKADRIVVVKSAHTMTLYSGEQALKIYKVALGRGLGRAKQRQGDHETPVGSYIIDARNSRSRFHLALHVSYPNAIDKAHARQLGVSPGGDIMIHGIEPTLAWLGSPHHAVDWTSGCVAVTNTEMGEIWKAVAVGTPVEIRP